MHVLKANINGNHNIGLYGYCTDSYLLLGREVPKKTADQFNKALNVPVHRLNIAGTSLLGVFLAGNSKKLLVPSTCFEEELKELERLKIDYEVIQSKVTCLGNTILCNEHGCLTSNDFSADQKKKIRQALDVPLKPGTISGLDNVGSLAAINSKACIISRDATPQEIKKVSELLQLDCVEASVNMGSPYIKSGLLCNSNGFIIGELSGGPEIVHIEEALGFQNKD